VIMEYIYQDSRLNEIVIILLIHIFIHVQWLVGVHGGRAL